MKKTMIAAVAAMAVLAVSGAYAAQDNSGCQGNCAQTGGTTTNNISNAGGQGGTAYGGTGGSANSVGVGVGYGGAGGQGGQGGSVVGSGNSTAIGLGGSVAGSGNSTAYGGDVKNSGNSNNQNTNVAAQGQKQGQQQGQKQSLNNKNNNQSSALSTSGSTGNSTNVLVQGDSTVYQAARIPVSTAYAPNIMPTAVCMGSSSLGAQGMSFGVSMGSSWTDSNCMLLEQVRTVSVVLGQKEIAQEMMMAVPAYAEAVKRLQGKGKQSAEVTTEADPKYALVQKTTFNDQDEIIRSRMGLPPLK